MIFSRSEWQRSGGLDSGAWSSWEVWKTTEGLSLVGVAKAVLKHRTPGTLSRGS